MKQSIVLEISYLVLQSTDQEYLFAYCHVNKDLYYVVQDRRSIEAHFELPVQTHELL